MRISSRSAVLAAIGAAALIGYQLGGWRTTVASAARDEAKELLQTDRAFDEATAKLGMEGWISYFADDGIMFPSNSDMIVGKQAIRKYATARFETPGYVLRWEPIDARVSGNMGYTYGVSKASRAEPGGKRVASYGKYVTIWKKQRGGTWQVAIDIGNSSPQPQGQK
jgi:uncharacterized protein (TIGR02246 family)